ncbi:uncharacterized protein LOC133906637 [Phragmites australis]|uniref:uncharacterized protein LOC133906637 n=1 Tax=Phragmites australis TaxID=29695 RepID=UPI002D783B72|nr:uncharacterized protein LOC133906637 [Phragmites australis]
MEKARRRHVPAFGEWNYYSSPEEPQLPPSTGAVPDWWYAPEPEACSDVWFRYSPPPRKPAPKKVSRPEVAPEKLYYNGGKESVPVERVRTADSGRAQRAPAKGTRRIVRPVDEDLYQVPPTEFVSQRPRRKREGRSLWMGCLGINCVS